MMCNIFNLSATLLLAFVFSIVPGKSYGIFWNTEIPSLKDTNITYISLPAQNEDCEIGKCTRLENCNVSDSIAKNATGFCGKRRNGSWVCCVRRSTDNMSPSNLEEKVNSSKPGNAFIEESTEQFPTIKGIFERWKAITQKFLDPSQKSQYNHIPFDGCIIGNCTRRELCTFGDNIPAPPEGVCGEKLPAGAWVCCVKEKDATSTTQQYTSYSKMHSTKLPYIFIPSSSKANLQNKKEDTESPVDVTTQKYHLSGGKNDNKLAELLYDPYYEDKTHSWDGPSEIRYEPEVRYHDEDSSPIVYPKDEDDYRWKPNYFEDVPTRRNSPITKRPQYDAVYDGYNSNKNDGCREGQCIRRKDCKTWNSNVFPASGNCAMKSGDWICCHRKNTIVYPTTTITTTRRDRYRPPTTTAVPFAPTRRSTTSTRTSYSVNNRMTPTTTFYDKADQNSRSTSGCTEGNCTERSKCRSTDRVAKAATGSCGKQRYGDWVCCVKKEINYRPTNPTSRTTTTTRYFNDRSSSKRPVWDSTTTRRGSTTTRRGSTTTRRGSAATTRNVFMTTTSYFTTTPKPNQHSFEGCGLREGFTSRTAGRYQMNPDAEMINPHSESSIWNNMVRNGKVVGGKEAQPYSWPWMVALFKEGAAGIKTFLCAGSLINHRYILTAAHVFTPKDARNGSTFTALLGTHTGSEGEGVAEYKIKSITLHPDYQHRYYYNDIALLELEHSVSYSQYIFPICLPSSNQYCEDKELVGKNVTVTGWGDDAFGGKSSGVLKEATFPIVSRTTCNSAYVQVASSKFPRGISEAMLCAGAPGGGRDACQGDSGGPLTIKNGRHWVQVGVVSFGYRCGDPQYPGVYTKVARYSNWIKKNSNMYR